MTPLVQTMIVVAIVLVAAVYLGARARRSWKAARRTSGCGPGCGC